jgi:hypothetical protein
MALTRASIEAMAPDQSALKAAAGLLKPAKWPLRAASGGLVWGECQGSGANPYRVAADLDDPGSKCTCPSRKFPCKHALALMWMHVDDPAGFPPGDVPDWVQEWMGRRRRGAGGAAASNSAPAKSLAVAETESATPVAREDPASVARRQAAAARRAIDTLRLVSAGLDDLDLWIADQLRTGLAAFVAEASERCRRIASRLVDAKAGALASRLDEAPSRLMALPAQERADAAIAELGKLTLAARAWRAAPDDPELRREVVATETREEVLADARAERSASTWEVLGERVATRRDGLVQVATWLLNLGEQGPRFALLLDYFPASAGRRSGAFADGQRLRAELAFYPARFPLRAVIVSRAADPPGDEIPWPAAPWPKDPLRQHADALLASPWRLETPLLLPPGRVAIDGAKRAWWLSEGDVALPLEGPPAEVALGAAFEAVAGVWTGARLQPLAGRSNWGRLSFDG